MAERFTERAQRAIVAAQEAASRLGHDFVDPGHILLGLLKGTQGLAKVMLEEVEIREEVALKAIREFLAETPAPVVFVESVATPWKTASRVPRGMAACPHVAGFVELPSVGGAIYESSGLLVLLRPGATPDQAYAELLCAVPDLFELSLQFKLPGERPVRKVNGHWQTVETGPRVFGY